MSSSRSLASKIKRNTTTNEKPGQQQQPQQQQQQQSIPKMLISDAIALITLRLGRVEHVVQNLPVESDEDNVLSNYDDVFSDIITRLESLENAQKKETAEVASLKDLVMKLQFFTLETNQKITQLEQRQQFAVAEEALAIVPSHHGSIDL
jgi:hypothetical protein